MRIEMTRLDAATRTFQHELELDAVQKESLVREAEKALELARLALTEAQQRTVKFLSLFGNVVQPTPRTTSLGQCYYEDPKEGVIQPTPETKVPAPHTTVPDVIREFLKARQAGQPLVLEVANVPAPLDIRDNEMPGFRIPATEEDLAVIQTTRNASEPLSKEAQAALEAGLESAKSGNYVSLGDFTKYIESHDYNCDCDPCSKFEESVRTPEVTSSYDYNCDCDPCSKFEESVRTPEVTSSHVDPETKVPSEAVPQPITAPIRPIPNPSRPRLVEACARVIGMKSMTPKEVVQGLQDRDWLPSSDRPHLYVSQTLSKQKEVFNRVERGVYGVHPEYLSGLGISTSTDMKIVKGNVKANPFRQ
jgi:hypothetical protein